MIVAPDGYLINRKMTTPRSHPDMARSRPRRQLAKYRAMLATARDRMAALIRRRESDSVDIFAAKTLRRPRMPNGRANDQAAANFLRAVYASLKQ